MDVHSAIKLTGQIVYRPEWLFTATDHTNRFEGSMLLRIDYPAQNTDREEAPAYTHKIQTYATFPIVVIDCDNISLYKRIMESILTIEEHEAREYFRIQPTFWAPFHPHNLGGMQRWGGGVERDLKFGIA